ncbi:MAG: acyl-ACP--UDP-N-acetylglucosamine O-acyltransferase [Candidatus Eremiobacteraeota bacterium]|nr:acyl-ACP--UDP-N-acetylglucosamine O-acyltransferase [Candidatus Eremiobacteraeota bacterium]MBV8222796.1 acyl-ACP--UDP-N-acetylglucosamine O-acyltransferase [Candidatus Eremiobacteraeota bacterium]MBV8281871.1 acyl-ACP--UDP-N-acetylglucosamine O-acyltransferase [Candidatus Eremiobacteraeota bacterium]
MSTPGDNVSIHTLNIHPTAVVHPEAKIGRDVEIGPYCLVGRHASIGDGTKLLAHVVVQGHTTIGQENVIYPFAVVGGTSQDKKFRGEVSFVNVGDRNQIREYVTIHRGTDAGTSTTIGSDCHLLAYVHIAHDCHVGDRVIMSNLTQLAGHCTVGEGANISGMVGVHQFVRIGRLAFIGGRSKILKDCPPFMLVEGNPAWVRGLNRVGLKRQGVSPQALSELKEAYRTIYAGDETLSSAIERLRAHVTTDEGKELVAFFQNGSQRGFTTQATRRGRGAPASEPEEEPALD